MSFAAEMTITAGASRCGEQAAHHIQPVAVGQVDVHEHQLRMQGLRELVGLGRGVGPADDAEARDALDEGLVDGGDAEVVVHDEDADRLAVHERTGVRAGVFGRITVKVAPGPSVTLTDPPSFVTVLCTSDRPSPLCRTSEPRLVV